MYSALDLLFPGRVMRPLSQREFLSDFCYKHK